jgi:hypothetical protein
MVAMHVLERSLAPAIGEDGQLVPDNVTLLPGGVTVNVVASASSVNVNAFAWPC